MQTLVGLRFVRTLASLGDEVPAYAKGVRAPASTRSAHETKRGATEQALRARSLPR